MYTPKIGGRASLLWFVSGVGFTRLWAPFERQRQGAVCALVAAAALKGDEDRWAELYSPGYQRQGSRCRVVYLN
jgi:hypothetical protein